MENNSPKGSRDNSSNLLWSKEERGFGRNFLHEVVNALNERFELIFILLFVVVFALIYCQRARQRLPQQQEGHGRLPDERIPTPRSDQYWRNPTFTQKIVLYLYSLKQ